MQEFLAQLRAFHDGLEPARRRALWAALAISLLAVIGVGVWASAPSYVTLTVASDTEEASRITRALAEGNVGYRTAADGLTIRVREEDELTARRIAAGDGGIVGLEGLEQIDPWVTPFQEQLHRKRMIQGELVRTIEGISGIRGAVVNLDLPPPSAFLRATSRPTASVTLSPDPGVTLDTRAAQSVAELVSHGVSGMVADDVRVIDTSTGRTLWAGRDDAAAGIESGATAAAREAALEADVRAALAQILGRGDAATVTVSVELESAQIQQTVNAIDPNSAAPSMEKIESETDARGGSVAAGVPGTDSNVPERAANASGSATGSRSRETTQTTYQYTSTTTTTVTPPGDIRRLAAAVVIDSAAVARVVAAGGSEEEVRAQLDAAVRAALGASARRGDEVVVTFLPFSAMEVPAAAEEAPVVSTSTAINAAIALAALVLAFVFVVRPLMAAVRKPTVSATIGGAVEDEDLRALLASSAGTLSAAGLAAAGGTPPTGPDGEPLPPNTIDITARLRGHAARAKPHDPKDVSELVRQESAHSAEVVRRWLKNN